MPLFSLIIPVYNRASLLEKTLLAINNQLFRDFEVIVIDDGSNPVLSLTNELLGQLTYPVRVIRQENKERGAARNNGIVNAAGHYVTFLDSDDRIHPEYFLYAKKYAEDHIPFFAFRHQVINESNNEVLWQALPEGKLPQAVFSGNFLSCHAVFIDKSIAQKNLFSENRSLSGLEDWELWIRLLSQYSLLLDDRITVDLIQHPLRSVVNDPANRIIEKVTVFTDCILKNETIAGFVTPNKKNFLWSAYSYAALHLALTRHKNESRAYWKKALANKPANIVAKRSLVIAKYLLLH